MLTHVHLKNFTIIESLSLDLAEGLSVLTGETGAGKSILIDAVSIGLGARFDARFMRNATLASEITLCFELHSVPLAEAYLNQGNIDITSECIIRRILTKEGRSKCYINDVPCTVQTLRRLGQELVHFYGQHEHQALLQPSNQRDCLDQFAGHLDLCKKVSDSYDGYLALKTKLVTLEEKHATAASQLAYLEHQLQEIEALGLLQGEWETISEKHHRYLKIKKNAEKVNSIKNLLTEMDQNVLTLLNQAVVLLTDMDDPDLINAKQLLDTAEIQLEEALLELQQYDSDIDIGEQAFQQLDEKLSKAHDLARKHRTSPDQLWQIGEKLREEIQELGAIDITLKKLVEQKELVWNQYQSLTNELTQRRTKAAKVLSIRATEQLEQLRMAGSHFEVRLISSVKQMSRYGQEQVVFMASTNPGQPVEAIQKIISGGELSRLGLALQVIALSDDAKPTLIFDEVDAGIGGRTAQTVGQLLRRLGQSTQVFCITHLVQVASQANHHFTVTKAVNNSETFVSIQFLDRQGRIKELARMSAGGKMTQSILQHAEALLAEVD